MNECVVEGCTKRQKRKKSGLCSKHTENMRLFGTYERPEREPRPRHRKPVVGYRAAHRRIAEARGKATDYDCECGCGRPAQEWALNTMHEVYWEAKPETGLIRPYSMDVFAYIALAIPCHRAMDGNNPPPRRVAA